MTIPIADLVRMQAGSTEIYNVHSVYEKSYMLKKLSTYAARANAEVAVRVAVLIWEDEEKIERMIRVKVLKQGRKRKKPGRKK